ncbi:MAG: hypothetical protein ABI995_00275 [Acidobacteriota bacterium]
MILSSDWRAFIESLNSHGVEYVLVGGHAVAYHGRPRFTDDLDVVVRRIPDNAARVLAALKAFGFGSLGLTESDFLAAGQIIQLGHPPYRIDVATSISGVHEDDLWQGRIAGEWEDVRVWWIDRASLVRNTRAVGRPKDLADLDLLNEDSRES